ncbi:MULTISPECIES: hypothetical protein [unclassified Spirosoma]|uniref:hypothetical protein n=1 Tax=unclassified Spirosoma TaxID=2621999 RepID=UPI000960B10A|nr:MULTISPECIES: hypothetical protein [unclassified Spirosoma]MBN8826802.1 hypothetical protein [Spirosoma sp.]OJW73626.1 MAG: hypothetical protein BGO59_19760 [Spirosoma sp. 48-14]
MLATVTGTYTNGQIILDEALPIKSKTAKVLVTLIEDMSEKTEKPVRELGRLKGGFTNSYWSSKEFNDPIDDLKDYME